MFTEIGDRLGYAMTLVLADVATLQLMFDSMPNIPYETFMDKYCYTCFIFLVIETIYCCFAGYGGEKVLGATIDSYVMVGFFAAFLMIHIGMLIYVGRRRVKEREKLWMTSDDIKEFYKLDPSETSTDVPHCECKWDSADSLHPTRNCIYAKHFPGQTEEEEEVQKRIEDNAEKRLLRKRSALANANAGATNVNY